MNIAPIVVGAFEVNCYICAGTDGQALVIDPGDDADKVIARLKQDGLSVAAYLLTHGHCDHITGLGELHDAFPAPVAIHPADRAWAFSASNTLTPFFPNTPRRPRAAEIDLTADQLFSYAGLPFSIIETPGHTPGGVCIYFADQALLVTGDTLFAGSVGRTDLPGGDSRLLAASLRKLKPLPDATMIYPGHGPSSTIAQEKRTNFYMQDD